jgi:hypothetical protein
MRLLRRSWLTRGADSGREGKGREEKGEVQEEEEQGEEEEEEKEEEEKEEEQNIVEYAQLPAVSLGLVVGKLASLVRTPTACFPPPAGGPRDA